jgi:hypothetical protein
VLDVKVALSSSLVFHHDSSCSVLVMRFDQQRME